MSDALAFLRLVLPEGGWYAAFSSAGPRKYNTFFATIEELAKFITVENALGKTVYHACASFVERTYRTQDNAWGARAFWLDIDAGKPNSAYATAMDAVNTLAVFCRDAGLPRPLVVYSGSGLHCYWPISTSLCPSDWWRYATALKRACHAHGLFCDPVRTADVASVLRTPGTHNRKLATVRVETVGPSIEPYEISAFDHLLAYLESGDAPRAVEQDLPALSQALIVEPDHAPVYADQVAAGCAQVARLRDATCDTEPHWYACLGVLSRCSDGQDKAHEWCSFHPNYTYKGTQDKLDRTLVLTGATTCAKFESINPAGCEGCVFRGKITSPISARAPVNTQAPDTTAAYTVVEVEAPPLPVLPAPFGWNARSELVLWTADGDKDVQTLISTYPIYLESVGVGEVRSDRFGFHFRQWLPHRGWELIHVSAAVLMGPGGAAEMAGRGANIYDWKTFVAYVRAATDAYHATEKLKMQYDQCGWKDDLSAFLAGDALYNGEGVYEHVTVSQELAVRAPWIGPQTGTLAGWSGAANALFASGCEAQSFALACSFAATLMRLQSSDEGGAVVNLLSRGSGTGKTTALAAVYSAWGKKQGLTLTKIDTRVSKAITLGVLGNLPVIYDELGDRDPEIIREFIAMFTNGRDKMRGHADGTVQHRQAAWQTLMISASNISIADLLSHSGGSDALSFRVLEFQCVLPEGVTPSRGDRLRKDLENNAGWAGDAYLNYLMQPGVLPWARETLEAWTGALWDKAGNKPQHRFWIRAVGAVAVASALVNNAGILEFRAQRIVDWAMDELFKDRMKPEPNTTERSIQALGEYLSDHTDAVLVVAGAQSQGGHNTRQPPISKPLRRLYMRYEINNQRLYIASNSLRPWLVDKGYGCKEVIDELCRVGVIINRHCLRTLGAGTDLVGAQVSTLEVDADHPAISGRLALVKKSDWKAEEQSA